MAKGLSCRLWRAEPQVVLLEVQDHSYVVFCLWTGYPADNMLYRLLQRILSIGGLEGGPHFSSMILIVPYTYGFSITKRIVERSAPFPKNTYAYFEVQNANVLTPHH